MSGYLLRISFESRSADSYKMQANIWYILSKCSLENLYKFSHTSINAGIWQIFISSLPV